MEFEFEDVKKENLPGHSVESGDSAMYADLYAKILSLTPDGDGFRVHVSDKRKKTLLQCAAQNCSGGKVSLKKTLPFGLRVVTRSRKQEDESYYVYIWVVTRKLPNRNFVQ